MKINNIFWKTFNIAENHYINILKHFFYLWLVIGYIVVFFVVTNFFNIYPYIFFNFHKLKKKFKIFI